MRQYPKTSPEFNALYYHYSQFPVDKTVSFRLPSRLALDFNKAVKMMGSKSSDELRNFMIDFILFAHAMKRQERRESLGSGQ